MRWSPTPTPCGPIASCSGARRPRASSAAALTNRPVPAWSSTLGWTGDTTISCTTTSSSPDDPEEEFEAIYKRGEPAPDPTCYVCAPARTEPGVAPPGAKPCMFSCTRPYLRPHHDWDRLFPTYRKTILEKLSRTAGLTDIEQHIRVRATADPGRHSRALRRLEWGHLRHCIPRALAGGFQALQSQPGREEDFTWRAALRTPVRGCPWS